MCWREVGHNTVKVKKFSLNRHNLQCAFKLTLLVASSYISFYRQENGELNRFLVKTLSGLQCKENEPTQRRKRKKLFYC